MKEAWFYYDRYVEKEITRVDGLVKSVNIAISTLGYDAFCQEKYNMLRELRDSLLVEQKRWELLGTTLLDACEPNPFIKSQIQNQ